MNSDNASPQPNTIPVNRPPKIHLTEIEKPSNISRIVESDVKPVLFGSISMVPYKFFFRCPVTDGKHEHCPAKAVAEKEGATFHCKLYDLSLRDKDTVFVHEIAMSDSRIIGSYKQKLAHINDLMLSRAPCTVPEFRLLSQVKDPEVLGVREAIFYPSAKIIEKGGQGDSIIDESGNPYRSQSLFLITKGAELITATAPVTITGKVHPHPKNQIPTISILETKDTTNDFRQFKMSLTTKELFNKINGTGLQNIADALPAITKIYERSMTHLLILLIFHSVPAFRFNGRLIKGTLEGLFIGDAGVGKTMILKTLIQKLKIGQFMTGSCSSRTGLSYSIVQIGGTWEIQWGAYPTNDMGLLIVDEGQDIPREDWEKLSVARSEGVLNVDRVAKGDHPSRTRLIVSANPKEGQQIESELHPCVHAKKLFTTKDIRRFDIIQCLSTSDVSREVLAKGISTNIPVIEWLNPDVLRESIFYAWSRKPDQVLFESAVDAAIKTCAEHLLNKYGSATDIPVVTSDIRDKLLRLAVAHAAVNHRTDAFGENIIVTDDDIRSVTTILDAVFSNKNFGLDSYSAMMTEESCLDPTEFNLIKSDLLPDAILNDVIAREIRGRNIPLFSLFIRNPEMNSNDICSVLDFDRKTIARFIEPFKKYGLITAKRGAGYKATRKFNKFVSYLKASGFDLCQLKNQG